MAIRLPVLILALFFAPALTLGKDAPPGFNLTARYEFDWNGLPLGRVTLDAKETPDSYTMHTMVKSRGLVSWFAKHSSDTVVKGNRKPDHYYAALYETHYQTKKKPKHVKIAYDGEGHILSEVVEPKDVDRPKIPEADKLKAYDLLSTVYVIRQKLQASLSSGAKLFDEDMYDGRRLSHLHFAIAGRENHLVSNRKTAVIHVTATRSPGAGHTPTELERMKDEPSMEIFFSDDGRLIPMAMEIHYLGLMRGQLVEECKTTGECTQ